jgi:hypothetical protein
VPGTDRLLLLHWAKRSEGRGELVQSPGHVKLAWACAAMAGRSIRSHGGRSSRPAALQCTGALALAAACGLIVTDPQVGSRLRDRPRTMVVRRGGVSCGANGP